MGAGYHKCASGQERDRPSDVSVRGHRRRLGLRGSHLRRAGRPSGRDDNGAAGPGAVVHHRSLLAGLERHQHRARARRRAGRTAPCAPRDAAGPAPDATCRVYRTVSRRWSSPARCATGRRSSRSDSASPPPACRSCPSTTTARASSPLAPPTASLDGHRAQRRLPVRRLPRAARPELRRTSPKAFGCPVTTECARPAFWATTTRWPPSCVARPSTTSSSSPPRVDVPAHVHVGRGG